MATAVGVQCTAGLMMAVKQTKPSRTCPLVLTLVPTLRPVDWDMASCNTSLKAMAKRMSVQLIFFFFQFWPKHNHISFAAVSDYTRTIWSHHTDKKSTPACQVICNLVMPILTSFWHTEHHWFRVHFFLQLKCCLQVLATRVAAPAGPSRAQG